MDVDHGGIQRLVPHECFDGQQINAVLIKMGSEGVSERMTGKALWPSKLFFMSLYVPGKKKGINRTGRIRLLREKPAGRTSAGEPVFSKDVKRIL